MNVVVTKNVNGFTYYLGKGGRWEGLKDNAVVYYYVRAARKAIDDLIAVYPKGKFGFIRY